MVALIRCMTLSAFLIVGISSCADADRDYAATEEADSIDEYRVFLHRWPKSQYAPEAIERLTLLEFELAMQLASRELLETFVVQWPDSKYFERATSEIVRLDFEDAISSASLSQLERLLEENLASDHAAKAAETWAILRIAELSQDPNADDLQKITDRFDDKHVKDAVVVATLKHIALEIAATDDVQQKQKLENRIIEFIQLVGPVQNYVIDDLPPKGNSIRGSMLIQESENESLEFKILYPDDILLFSTGGAGLLHPFASGSVWRFAGSVDFFGFKIRGDKHEPLTFLVLSPRGFVYIHGSGSIAGQSVDKEFESGAIVHSSE